MAKDERNIEIFYWQDLNLKIGMKVFKTGLSLICGKIAV